MELENGLVYDKDIISTKKQKLAKYEYMKIKPKELSEKEDEGWIFERKYKTLIKIKREINLAEDEAFENRVWILLANLGFSYLNSNRHFKLCYSEKDSTLTQQIDVFAADEESIIIVECKASKELNRKHSFKTEIEALGGKINGLTKAAKKMFPRKRLKVKFVFATQNYALSDVDKGRLKDFGIVHFDEDAINYYEGLLNHIGIAARYQLLGNLFSGLKIPELDTVVPAIRGEMGQHIYYSFSIEPEKLLKLGFILHHDNAYKDEMPAYQRIIKKNRLKAVREFVEAGGFFPNSIIINIDAKKALQFDVSGLQSETSISKLGLLHLPQTYKSIYIIDGQHRLYGYSGSKWGNKNTIPVVAFVNLDKFEQIKLFMDINENQKAVPKNLRNTLDSDLLWNSDDFNAQRKALSSRIAQRLADDKKSPLFGRIVVGENAPSIHCSVTLDIIVKSLRESNFYNKYNKQDILKNGTFDKGNNDATYKILLPFLIQCFDYIEQFVTDDWKKSTNEEGSFICNTFIYALIKIFSDIIDYLCDKRIIEPKSQNIDEIVEESRPYLDLVAEYLQRLTHEEKMSFRKEYGRVGDKRLWRTLQQQINNSYVDFSPEGMTEFWENNSKKYNEESYKIIRDLELHLKKVISEKLKEKYGINWFRSKCIPKVVYDEAQKLAADKNYSKEEGEPDCLPQDMLHLINYREIALYGSNWSEMFESILGQPDIKGNKKDRTEWMVKLNAIRNQNFHTYSVSSDEYDFLVKLKQWLVSSGSESKVKLLSLAY